MQPDRTLGRFERILVNGVMQTVPEALLARLEIGGRLVGALRVEGAGRLVVVTRAHLRPNAIDVSIRSEEVACRRISA